MSAAGLASAVLVTRGNVPLDPIVDTLTADLVAEVVVWNNDPNGNQAPELVARTEAAAHVPVIWANVAAMNLSVYGRYAALRACTGTVAYVQDDDCLLPPTSIRALLDAHQPGVLVANMPAPFRAHYTDSCLIGFGAVFDVALAHAAFERFLPEVEGEAELAPDDTGFAGCLLRCADVVFTTLTPATWLDVPYENLPYATDAVRMYRQPNHVGERTQMLRRARLVRDA